MTVRFQRVDMFAGIVVLASAAYGADDMRMHFAQKLNENTNWADQDRTANLCGHVQPKDLKPAVKDRCRDALEARAKANLESSPSKARAQLNLAVAMGLAPEKAASYEVPLRKAEKVEGQRQKAQAAKEKAEAAKMAAAETKKIASARKFYGENLRQKYLDDGLDIKVFVSGPANRVITLKFALFNDVWANKFRKGDLIEEMQTIGFTRVNMTDGFDYSVYWNLKK